MKLKDAVAFSACNLLKNPVRTFLTILGMGVGVGAILTVITLGSAGQTRVEAEISRMGVDKVWIVADDGSDCLLQPEDAERVKEAVAAEVCAGAGTMAGVTAGNVTVTAQVAGYDAGMQAVHQPAIVCGRMITQTEHEAGSAVALVDESLEERLGGHVCGEWVYVGHRAFRIVGVMRDMTVQSSSAAVGTVVMSWSAYRDTFAAAQITGLTVNVPRGSPADVIADKAEAALEANGGSFHASSLEEEIDAARSVIRIFVMVLACVAAVCMITGGIGVMNILLVSVRERRGEIGLMKAVGGAAHQVGLIFLLEAVGYAFLGCMLGIALGVAMIAVFGSWIGIAASLDVGTAAVTTAAACLLGVGFGVAPALRAAGMTPIGALKGNS